MNQKKDNTLVPVDLNQISSSNILWAFNAKGYSWIRLILWIRICSHAAEGIAPSIELTWALMFKLFVLWWCLNKFQGHFHYEHHVQNSLQTICTQYKFKCGTVLVKPAICVSVSTLLLCSEPNSGQFLINDQQQLHEL